MPYDYEMKVHLPAGPQQFTVAFINDFSDPKAANPNLRKRNLYINYLEVENPSVARPFRRCPRPWRRISRSSPRRRPR